MPSSAVRGARGGGKPKAAAGLITVTSDQAHLARGREAQRPIAMQALLRAGRGGHRARCAETGLPRLLVTWSSKATL